MFLADRLLVMENRPTRVRRALDVPLDRPRDRRDPAALEIKAEALELLHEEARRSFNRPGEAA